MAKFLDLAGLTAYDKKIKEWIKSSVVDITDDEILALFKTEDGYTVRTLKKVNIPAVTYGEVDLGLPSGIKWADRNVGAETPQDNGAYFSWGNVEGVVSIGTTKKSKDYLIELFIILMLGGEATPEQIEEFKNNPEMMSQIEQMIPMFLSEEYGLISEYSFDTSTYSTTMGGQYTGSTLDTEHDAATANMGSDWRMPTSTETLELVENTDHYYIGEDGSIVAGPFDYGTTSLDKRMDGSRLRSICFVKKGETFDYDNRSNFIEFPFAGCCSGSLLSEDGLVGYVWSSSVNESNVENARYLSFSSGGNLVGDGYLYRFGGQSVRGVHA